MDNPEFWRHKSLSELSHAEWEALCDRCGRCCLHKLEDEEDGQVYYTAIACKLLDVQTGQCRDYAHRHQYVPDCTDLSLDRISQFHWLPRSCAYRRLAEGHELADWHPLCSGTQGTVAAADIAIAGKVLSEDAVASDELQEYVIYWFD